MTTTEPASTSSYGRGSATIRSYATGSTATGRVLAALAA